VNPAKSYPIILFFLLLNGALVAQPVPAADENIPYLMTFGGNSLTSWGDDDFCQIFFCVIPASQKSPFYLRVYDPDTGGDLDELKGSFNTVLSFSVYGGTGCWTDTAAQNIHLNGNYKRGFQITSRSFGNDPKYDKQWFSLGPFNPSEGEKAERLGGFVFKIIAQGVSGDDGNIYRYFLSSSPSANVAVEGANFFTYKYHFRLPDNQKQICQIYPFVDDRTISFKVLNFDWDNDGLIRVFSVAKNGLPCSISGEDQWAQNQFPVVPEEKNSSLEIQFIKNQSLQVKNNNVVIAVLNQYGVSMPFYVIPIGGVPVYTPKIRMK